MNAMFKPVSDRECFTGTNIETGLSQRLVDIRLKECHAMLVFIIAGAVIGSFFVEYLVHLLADNYEIEWTAATETAKSMNSAQEIAIAMRKTHRESERQMNKAFKMASGAHC
ncbi:hypothetical protein [Rhizobium sp. AC27/96]|uniref:hypothetical protein n=1 Tax=Rhizobium sp. AC27/96 TaxID=1841653 RepID=UPI001FCD9599|nr:hypothetical protein [Rhizobium sp. AC27/96]